MSRIHLTAVKSLRYGTRMMRAGDTFEAARQDARVLTAVGLARETGSQPQPAARNTQLQVTKPAPAPREQTDPEVEALREEFKAKTGRRPHYRWTAESIREAIASLNEAQDLS